MSEDDPLVRVAIPPLVAILLHHEKAKGEPLTQEEVVAIRDRAVCMTVPYSVAADVEEKRGYPDIRLEHPWEDWSAVRGQLHSGPDSQDT